MIGRILIFVIGFLLMIVGFSYIILYTNLISFGYTVAEYLSYLVTRYECYFTIIGLILVLISIFGKGIKNVKRI